MHPRTSTETNLLKPQINQSDIYRQFNKSKSTGSSMGLLDEIDFNQNTMVYNNINI